MKLIRTVQAHERLVFGKDDDTDLSDLEHDDVTVVDNTGAVVSEADATRYEKRADELGVAVEVTDAEKGDTAPAADPVFRGDVATGGGAAAVIPTPPPTQGARPGSTDQKG